MGGGASLPQQVFLIVLNHLRSVVSTCFDKNTVWVHLNASGSDFIGVVLIRTFPGALSRLTCHPFCFAKNAENASWCQQLLFAKLDSLEIISGADFRIIGLTKVPKIEFLPLDWIYRSI